VPGMATGPCIDRLAIICHSDYYTYNEVFLINLRLYHPENTSHDHNIAVYTKIHSDSTFFCSTVIANLLAFSCRFIAAIYQLSKCVYISMPLYVFLRFPLLLDQFIVEVRFVVKHYTSKLSNLLFP
jgi:hypothetical protein